FYYGPMEEVLPRVRLVLSVSSTALMEAIFSGIDACAITDLGLRESFGSHYFIGSGICASFDQLIKNINCSKVNPGWADKNGLSSLLEFKGTLNTRREFDLNVVPLCFDCEEGHWSYKE